ncbi:unnamed protein product [Caenorhabditis auriculariae]|uniref:PXA domain-containing protein n=1 Tax=Caenorhabditis auriculariae TaxID=2777116 RepID=A0A8S1HLX9_9PELO|nr:unnamed protein product [Caenorhabditis auriculariae]
MSDEETWRDRARKIAADRRFNIAVISVVLTTFSLIAGFGIFPTFILTSSLLFGLWFSTWIFLSTNGQLFDAFLYYISPTLPFVAQHVPPTESEEKFRQMPWEGLTLSPALNESLENLLDVILHQYVNAWYENGISRDKAFLDEIRYQIRYACAKLVRFAKRVDEAKFISETVVPTAMLHFTRLAAIKQKLGKDNIPLSMLEGQVSEKLGDLHLAMASRKAETDYIRQIAEVLIPRLLDETRLAGRSYDDDSPAIMFKNRHEKQWPSQSARFFIRELIANALLLPFFDLITEPDTINYWLILLFDTSTSSAESFDQDEVNRVSFLKGFGESSNDGVPDSLLQLKLTEILRDARQFSMFRMYLQDIRGPTNELNFLAEATRVHECMQRKSISSSQLSYDIWQLFGKFVHESAEERIPIEKEVVEQFQTAVESNDFDKLDRIIETTYQSIYQKMQVNYVVPFCQSECFLGYLCGSPPVFMDELIDRKTQEKRADVTEHAFSLSQLRAKVRKALTSASEDSDSLDSGYGITGTNYRVESQISQDEYATDETPSSLSIEISEENDDSESDRSEPQESPYEESIQAADRLENADARNVLIIDPDARDINNWRVSIGKVAPIQNSMTGRTFFVFVIEVERADAKAHETKKWSIHRSFNEFYVLESKLNEFHGTTLRFSPLPPRKAFVAKDRPFMEQHRLIFSTFLSTLSKQKVLNRSELLLTFLSSNEEFRDNLLLSDLNPWKVMKRMPKKLTREKGQNLRPFLLKTLANCLAPSSKPLVEPDDANSVSVESSSVFAPEQTYASNSNYSSVFGNNFSNITNFLMNSKATLVPWTRSAMDSILLLVFFLLKESTSWICNVLAVLRIISKQTVDMAFHKIFSVTLKKALSESNLAYLVQKMHYSLFSDPSLPATDQEKAMREELAKRRTLEFVENLIQGKAGKLVDGGKAKIVVRQIVESLQFPRLNKQLFYVLLDSLIIELFPEISPNEAIL